MSHTLQYFVVALLGKIFLRNLLVFWRCRIHLYTLILYANKLMQVENGSHKLYRALSHCYPRSHGVKEFHQSQAF